MKFKRGLERRTAWIVNWRLNKVLERDLRMIMVEEIRKELDLAIVQQIMRIKDA